MSKKRGKINPSKMDIYSHVQTEQILTLHLCPIRVYKQQLLVDGGLQSREVLSEVAIQISIHHLNSDISNITFDT